MTHPVGRPYQIAAFTADLWEHVCPSIRIVEPILQSGMKLIKGSDWVDGTLQVYPEIISKADLVVIQRDFPRHIEQYNIIIALAHELSKPVIYELDDLLIDLVPDHPAFNHYLESRPSILRAVEEADAITVSSNCLCDYLRTFNPNVWLLPNYLNDHFWNLTPPLPKNISEKPLRIGYMGGDGHVQDIEMIYPMLSKILDRFGAKVELKFWGLRPSEDFMSRSNVSWTHPYLVEYSAFAQYFIHQECDVFLAPLQDNIFNRCKSGLKYLEYSALGVPGVYSNLPSYAELITNGKDGFLATSNEEWEKCLIELVENPTLRNQMGIAARLNVQQKWLLSQNASRWEEAYNKIITTYRSEGKFHGQRADLVVKEIQKMYVELVQIYKTTQEVDRASAHELALEDSQLEQKIENQEKTIGQIQSEINEKDKRISSLTQKIEENGKALGKFQLEIFERDKQVNAISSTLFQVQNSTAWKVTNYLFRLRLALAPTGSLRERLFRLMVAALRVWRAQGFRQMVPRAVKRITNRRPIPSPELTPQPSLSPITYFSVDGTKCLMPAVSIVQVANSHELSIDLTAVQNWLNHQTWTGWELIIWDQIAGKAWEISRPEQAWESEGVVNFMRGLSGKYICIASQDLLGQSETYLEANLIALETDNLAFTINLQGKAEWARRLLAKGALPGSRSEPLLRSVINKNCLQEDFSIDISAWAEKQAGNPVLAGRVISHTTTAQELEGNLSFNSQLTNTAIKLIDDSIAAQYPERNTWGQILHPIQPVDTVLEAIDCPSSRPTVLMFMPFLAVGGAERVALDMISCLKDNVRFVVFTLDEHDPSIGTTVDSFRELTPFVYTAHDFLNYNLNFSFVNYLIERFHPCTLYIANGSPWIYDALSTIKQVHPELRLVNQVYDHAAGWINRYDSVLSHILDANIGVNQKICDAFVNKGVLKEKVYLIENGVNTMEFDPSLYNLERERQLKLKFGIKLEAKVITFMGRLHPQKRPMDFVEVARRFADEPNLHFLMVGDGILVKSIEQEIARIGLTNITRLSFYRPSSDIFAISQVFVLPSEYEGMPMVILEAQSMGKPVVVTDVGNNREVLNITKGGRLISRIGDVSAIRQAIMEVLSAPPDPQEIRQAIIKNFDLQIMGKKYRSALLGR